MTAREFTVAVDVLMGPCPKCAGPIVEQRVGVTRWCVDCEAKMDEFDTEARRLLTDTGGRSWAQVEMDVARALRERARP